MKKKIDVFGLSIPGVNLIKLFLSVIYEFLNSARVFVRLGWKRLPGTNTLAYYEHSQITEAKSFMPSAAGVGAKSNYRPSLNIIHHSAIISSHPFINTAPNKLECLKLKNHRNLVLGDRSAPSER